ncbi:glycosyltransferase [Kordiimonas aestuarii]|uniref:glycosyltransferase n=1 Tax=Kordiimonas aestuarii TaxID=1005925 RepID=UPI0021D2E1D9|nr:glycosyltransferase [Kordiimonas aestuarii]
MKLVRDWFAQSGRVAQDFYMQNNPDVEKAGIAPVDHFVEHGLFEGRDPHPDYRSSDIALILKDCRLQHDEIPLLAYLSRHVGDDDAMAEGQVEELLEKIPALQGDAHFGHLRALRDFVLRSDIFNPKFYLKKYGDVGEVGADPVLHFVLYGAGEGRLPSERFARFLDLLNADRSADDKVSVLDGVEYLQKVGIRTLEVFNAGVPHDLIFYALEHKFFDVAFYNAKSGSRQALREDAILHFIRKGEHVGRRASHYYSKGRLHQFASYYGTAPGLSLFWNFIRIAQEKKFTTWSAGCRSLAACSDWVTPGKMGIVFRQGAVREEWSIGASQVPGDRYRYPLFAGVENALTIPFVVDRRKAEMLEIRSVALHGEQAVLRYVIEDANGASVARTGRLVLRQDDEPCTISVPLMAYHFEIEASRYFLKIWLEDEQADVDIVGANFDAAFHFRRAPSFQGLELQHAQHLPALRDNATDDVVLWFGAPGKSRSALARSYLGEYFEGAIIIDALALKHFEDFLAILPTCKVAVFDAGRFGAASKFFGVSTDQLVTALTRSGTVTAGIAFTDEKPRNITNFIDVLIELEASGAGPEDEKNTPPEEDDDEAHVVAADWWCNRLRPWQAETEPKPIDPPYTVTRLQEACFDLPALPHVVIVSVLYKKAEVVQGFLEAINRQTYQGPLSVVLVDDCSPDGSYETALRAVKETEETRGAHISVHVIQNSENSGNCLSRNTGIKYVEGDIYSVIDCDCLINDDYVTAHLKEHLHGQANVVVGPLNLETHGRPAWDLLHELESSRDKVLASMNMQDDVLYEGFVNTITRNLSVRREWIETFGGFDPDFSYSARKNSGFGWEDVELGARIYKSGANIAFTPDAFSLHQSHGTSVPVERQIVGSATNFNKLFKKHPDIALAARRWSTDTAMRIGDWAKGSDVEHPELEKMRQRFDASRKLLAPFIKRWRRPSKRLRVVSLRWHVPHQYEIHKLPFDFTLLTGTGTGFTNEWAYHQRALRPNVKFLPVEQFDPRDYDVCIMHFDENVLCSDLCNGIIGPDWGHSFKWFLENVPLPKVAICHGTPPFKGQYGQNPEEIRDFEIHQHEVERLRHLLSDVMVICNSHQAALEWGFKKSRVIWHGVDPQEFPPGTHDLDILSVGSDWNRPHYRGVHMLERILEALGGGYTSSSHKHFVGGMPAPHDARFQQLRFRRWVDHIRRHKLYLNTTLRSPMPRSRSEAMMCGVIPVTLNNHDAAAFIRQGVNGFYGDSEEELMEYIKFICRNDGPREKISKAARMTAMNVFNNDRFLADWMDNLTDMGLLD